MKKVLVLTYSYYPSFHGGVPRIAAFCKYLGRYGWTPTLLAYDSTQDVNASSTDKKDVCDVYRIKTKKTQKAHALAHKMKVALKLFKYSFEDIAFISFEKELYKTARRLCKEQKFDAILASSLPQCVHRVAAKLGKEFGIPWVADHRDLVGQDKETKQKWDIIKKIDRKRVVFRDSKYDKKAARVVTVSQGLADLIYKRAKRTAVVIPNGYDEDDFKGECSNIPNNKMRIVYTGSLFGDRNIELLFDGLVLASQKSEAFAKNTSMAFFGSCCTRVDALLFEKKYESIKQIIENNGSVSHERSIKEICSADILYLISHPAKGIATGKIYEYLAAKKTILSAPGDGDITDEIIKQTSSGYVAKNAEELSEKLLLLHSEWIRKGFISTKIKLDEVVKYNRKTQTEKLAEILEEVSCKRKYDNK